MSTPGCSIRTPRATGRSSSPACPARERSFSSASCTSSGTPSGACPAESFPGPRSHAPCERLQGIEGGTRHTGRPADRAGPAGTDPGRHRTEVRSGAGLSGGPDGPYPPALRRRGGHRPRGVDQPDRVAPPHPRRRNPGWIYPDRHTAVSSAQEQPELNETQGQHRRCWPCVLEMFWLCPCLSGVPGSDASSWLEWVRSLTGTG